MGQHFREKNFRGRSFKGKDLTDADFSYSDIRGADFTDANLSNANFSHAKAGLQPHWAIGLVILSILLSALSGFTAATLSLEAVVFFLPQQINIILLLATGVVALIVYVVFWFITVRQGLWTAILAIGVGAALASVGHMTLNQTLDTSGAAGKVTLWVATGAITGASAVATAGVVAVVMAGAMVAAGTLAGVGAVVMAGAVAVAVVVSEIGTIAEVRAAAAVRAGVGTLDIPTARAVAAAASVAVAGLCIYVGWRVLAGDEKHTIVRSIAVAISSTGGTSFRKANLTKVDLSYAILKSTDFRQANITRTFWHKAIKLDWARVGNTILENPAVRDLLVTGNGSQKSYVGMNLRGANLIGADLTEANFKRADISQATLRDACLEGANLTQTQAIGTDFSNAQMTGVRGLGKWNIDTTTELEDVDCRWVYLLEYPKPRTNDCERRPSSGEFAAGDFTKLYQQILDTVDLIFHNGIDWTAFKQSFTQVQIENEGIELAIKSIENKDDGVVIVKVKLPPDANKSKIHSDFLLIYEENLKVLEERYQAQIKGQEALIERYHQQHADMLSLMKQLAAQPNHQFLLDKLVILSFENGDFDKGFATITAQIWADRYPLPTSFKGTLLPQPEIPELYQQWHDKYKNLMLCYQAQGWYSRIKPLPNEVKQVSVRDIYKLKKEIQDLANELKKQVNTWLNSESFSPIQNKLRSKLNPCDRIRFLIQSEDIQIRRLPWHLWNFFEEYRQAEVAFSPTVGDRVAKSVYSRTQLRILAILGNSQGINVDEDRQLLENFLQAETVFLVEPTRREFDESLWDEQGWDILCFSGHSSSQWDGSNGWIHINKTDKLTIEQLENALKAAIERGLHLVILNSCDGLGLARYLDDLHIPQIIVMREPVPDLVAQEFLKNFLTSFSGGKSLYVSVREAREKLQSMEDNFPCASWLPVICQNHAEVPQLWQEL
jgi:uncharacterized protein YjbI with pentapeptide repeats